jgi:CO/xanthine dehydrogenase Mo-binding subunit
MRGAIHQYEKFKGRTSAFTDAVEEAQEVLRIECARRLALEKEQRELRLARITNGKHPDFRNGHPKDGEKRGS